MTLIELMVVIILVALASTATFMSIGALSKSRLRSSCMRIVAASRFAYSRAISHGTTVRILLDTDENTMTIQEAHGRVTLARQDDERRLDMDESEEGRAAVDPWEAARQRLETTLEPSFGASPFGPIRGRGGETLTRYQTQAIGDSIEVVRLILPHEPEPREQGKGSIYFFPSGMTEHAVVQLSDGSDAVYSVEIHPLTGRGKVHRLAYEPDIVPEDADEEDFSEVEDDG